MVTILEHHLCDYAFTTSEGHLSYIGIRDRFVVSDIPGKVRFYYAARVQVDPGEIFELGFRISDAQGAVLIEKPHQKIRIGKSFNDPYLKVGSIVIDFIFEFEKPGDHFVEVVIDKTTTARLPCRFEIVK